MEYQSNVRLLFALLTFLLFIVSLIYVREIDEHVGEKVLKKAIWC